MPQAVSIGLVFDYGHGYCRSVLRGIRRYAESKPQWTLFSIMPNLRAVEALAKLPPEGMITWVFQQSMLDVLKDLKRPWVSVCGIPPDDGTPRVGLNDFLVGQLAASHLLDLGLKRFG